MADNRVIGRNNQLPWYLPNDLKYFKRVTMAKPVIMGRKTFDSIGRPLPGRTNIVVTRNSDYQAEGVKVVHSLAEALAMAESIAIIEGGDEVMVIGGAQLYEEALPYTDNLYLTKVHSDSVEGDAYFPELDWAQWNQVSIERFAAEGPNPYDYSFCLYTRA
ncbi:IS1595 family transposase ISSsu9 [Sinobacterium norvegicum]|uniref:Dihydrofolate reductase n=2 Tax=Sinobacterium norvegicum TaxID=1641715 RepID=A0ABM9AHZ2_9GAMM|nr:IS1595 family transposase ISSsu9 [Sinobacterium norvegicum]